MTMLRESGVAPAGRAALGPGRKATTTAPATTLTGALARVARTIRTTPVPAIAGIADPPASAPSTDVLTTGPGSPRGARHRGRRHRAYWQTIAHRFAQDKLAVAAVIVIALVLLGAIFASPIESLLGVTPDRFNTKLYDHSTELPLGSFGGVSWAHPFGVEPQSGRDIFARILTGAQPTMVIAVCATGIQLLVGVAVGATAGYMGGWVDAVLSRLMEIALAFPLLLFLVAVGVVIPTRGLGLGQYGLHLLVMVVVIGVFTWAYPARIIRGQVLALRDREFVAAARLLGAGGPRIVLREILPNLGGPIAVYASIAVPANILLEAYLSYLGVGIPVPYASWGGMVSSASDYYSTDPTYLIVPAAAIVVTVLAFNIVGDALRDALDPRDTRPLRFRRRSA